LLVVKNDRAPLWLFVAHSFARSLLPFAGISSRNNDIGVNLTPLANAWPARASLKGLPRTRFRSQKTEQTPSSSKSQTANARSRHSLCATRATSTTDK